MTSDIAAKIHEHLSQYPVRNYAKGEILVLAGENPEHILYLASGRVRKYDVSYRGEEVVINIFKPPAFFPMSWALNHTPNKYFYKAETKATIHLVPASDATAFLNANPDVALDLLARLYTGLEGMYGRLTLLMAGTAHGRIMHELSIMCRRFSKPQTDHSYQLDINETDLAAMSGLSRETVSREIAKLKALGWLHLDGKHVTVTDLVSLEKALSRSRNHSRSADAP